MCADARAQRPEPSGPAPGFLDSIKPLEIGESIPEYLWHLPLKVVNHAEGTETITLNDYKGKLIILDFWATWCKSCIANMPRMHELEEKYGQDMTLLPVTYEDANRVAAFLANTKNAVISELRASFRSIADDSALRRLFPNPTGTIPYFAVIGQDGIFQGPTVPSHMDERLIRDLIADGSGYIPPLRGVPDTPLLERSQRYADNRLNKPHYYAMLSGYMDGFTYPAGYFIDSLNGVRRDYFINQPLMRLYCIALSTEIPRVPSRRILLVDSAAQLDDHTGRNPGYDVFRYNYCYEATYPLSTSQNAVKLQMLVNLNTYTGFTGGVQNLSTQCLVIRVANGQPGEPKLLSGSGQYLSMSSFVWKLNHQHDAVLPFVIDETGFSGKVYLDGSVNMGDTAQLRRFLREQGFDLASETRELAMFVLAKDEMPNASAISLELTPYGYLRKEEDGE